MSVFLIADTFTDSLARLTGDEQKAVKTTAFDLQMDPSATGFSFHKLDKAKDKHFWSPRVNVDIRLIVHKTDDSLLLCYVDHHDRAYTSAERRKLETHSVTGAAQIVELRESIREIVVPSDVQATRTPTAIPLAGVSESALLGYGVPAEWVEDVRAADEDRLLALTAHLPAEAAEAVLELATGGKPRVPHQRPPRTARRSVRSPIPTRSAASGWSPASRTRASTRGAVGEVGGLPPSRSARSGLARLQRPGSGLGVGGHREDHRCPPPGGSLGPGVGRRPRSAGDVL